MSKFHEDLPVELVGTNVLGYLSLKDIVLLERACGSKKSHQAFMEPVVLPSSKHHNMSVLLWFANRHCKIELLTIQLPDDSPGFHVKNLQVDYFDVQVTEYTTVERLQPILRNKMGFKISIFTIRGNVNKVVMEQLSACTGNVKQLTIRYSNNCMDWLTADILSRWKLKEISFDSAIHVELLLVLSKTELTSIKLLSNNIDDAAVIAIAQHCPKLETLLLRSSNITWASLLALSERGLPLEELDIDFIPNIPTTDIARRCSHALSCIRHISTDYLYENDQNANIIIPSMTRLTSVYFNNYSDSYIPLLTQHCHKLTKITVLYNNNYSVTDMLSLCRANPLLEVFIYYQNGLIDAELKELIHACPHLHTLTLPYETNITDTGILALSENCPQLGWLNIRNCHKVTEAAVLQLLQCCRKLTTLEVSSSSLSEETWTQLDKNTQKRVCRW